MVSPTILGNTKAVRSVPTKNSMAKRKKAAKEEGTVRPAVQAKDIAKDIDEIFAERKSVKSVDEKPQKPKSKQSISRVAVATTAVKAVEDDLASVQTKVKAAKAGRLSVVPVPGKHDDFADIRGTKKRKQSSFVLLIVTGKRTEDGLALYKEDELRIGQGGDTELCPFDCDCCK